MPTPNVPHDAASENTEFTFVADQNPRDLRSHAMREHWKHRRRQKSEQTRRSQPYQPLLAKTELQQPKPATAPALSGTSSAEPCPDETWQNKVSRRSHRRRVSDLVEGIPTQVLSGMNLALANSRLDPFDRFPVKFTAQHHKLLYHWLSIYATMMFDSNQSPSARFNPMRDIWLPLDLSNAAAFNAVMAQSAAHLSRMQGFKISAVALKFKAEAMRIISLWMADKDLALGDDVIAAVSRILIYERYWGTEAEWQVHRRGLLQMIDARGGIASLHSNWRLELTIYLISLMTKPSWFDSSNQLWEICDSPMSLRLHRVLGDEESLHRVRCLWLISFIQDMRTLMNNSLETYANGITKYTAIQKALGLIGSEVSEQDTPNPDEDVCSDGEYRRLACLLFISATLQSSISNSFEEENMDSGYQSTSNLDIDALEAAFFANTLSWATSTEHLYNMLFCGTLWNAGDDGVTSYVLNLAAMVSRMSVDTRRGVEMCLLRILRQVPASVSFSLDDTWTPDGLLSSTHGD